MIPSTSHIASADQLDAATSFGARRCMPTDLAIGDIDNSPSCMHGDWPVIKTKIRKSAMKVLLSIDGGGLRGLLPAMTLEVLEEELRNVLYDLYLRGLLPLTDLMCSTQDNVDVDATVRSKCFHVHIADFLDCTIGTSTGSILASHIATAGCGVQASQMLQDADFAALYSSRGPRSETLWSRLVSRLKRTIPKSDTAESADANIPNPAASRNRAPRPDSAAAATDTYLAKASCIFQGQTWQEPVAKVTAALAKLPLFPVELRGALRPLHANSGLQATLRQAFAGSSQPYCRSANDRLKTSLVIPAFELENEWKMENSKMQADMKRGNRPVAFYADKHKDADSGYLNTNRAFLYGTVDGRIEGASMPGLDRKQDSFQAHLLYQDKRDFELAEVVQASCSAPTYFRAATVKQIGQTHVARYNGKTQYVGKLVDGGLAANYPPLLGLVFMTQKQKVRISDIAILSLGTGQNTAATGGPTDNCGSLGWARKIITTLMTAGTELYEGILDELYYNSMDAANGMKLYQYTRINYAAKEKGMYSYWRDWFTKAGGLSPKRVGQVLDTLDDTSAVSDLQKIGNVMAQSHRRHLNAFVEDFCFAAWSPGNKMQQLVHDNGVNTLPQALGSGGDEGVLSSEVTTPQAPAGSGVSVIVSGEGQPSLGSGPVTPAAECQLRVLHHDDAWQRETALYMSPVP